MRVYSENGVHIAEAPASCCVIEILDAVKSKMPEDAANAGFFATYKEDGVQFTLPVAHLTADFGDLSAPALKYMKERGTVEGSKWRFNAAKWGYMNDFQGKAISTLYIQDGKARIAETAELEQSDYAVSGVPIIRNGKASTITDATAQGWTSGSLYATQHIFVGIKEAADTLYIMHLTTKTVNLVSSKEAAAKFLAMGFKDVIKLDGGGSTRWQFDGTVQKNIVDRQIHNIIRIKGESSTPDTPSEKGEDTMANINAFSKAKDGDKKVVSTCPNFKVKEFACKDGSDPVFIAPELVKILQKVRNHFGKPVSINSGYRTPAYNKKVGGATYSQHQYGTAADIVVSGVAPKKVAAYVETLMPKKGGIGIYSTFTHIDVRATKSRWNG